MATTGSVRGIGRKGGDRGEIGEKGKSNEGEEEGGERRKRRRQGRPTGVIQGAEGGMAHQSGGREVKLETTSTGLTGNGQ